MWANIPSLLLLHGESGGDLAISNPDLHSANNGDEGMTASLLVTHKTVEPPANISPCGTQQSDLY